MQQYFHYFVDVVVYVITGESAGIKFSLHILHDQGDGIKRLAPLVGNMANHFPHGCLAILLDQRQILAPQVGNHLRNSGFQRFM